MFSTPPCLLSHRLRKLTSSLNSLQQNIPASNHFLDPSTELSAVFLTSLHWETIPKIVLQVPHGREKSHHSDAAYDFAHITLCAVSLHYYKATVLIQVQLTIYQDSHNLPSIATLQSDRP